MYAENFGILQERKWWVDDQVNWWEWFFKKNLWINKQNEDEFYMMNPR